MKNITLSAEERSIERARAAAVERHTTLNQLFRDWLKTLDPGRERVEKHQRVVAELRGQVAMGGRSFTREEMNER